MIQKTVDAVIWARNPSSIAMMQTSNFEMRARFNIEFKRVSSDHIQCNITMDKKLYIDNPQSTECLYPTKRARIQIGQAWHTDQPLFKIKLYDKALQYESERYLNINVDGSRIAWTVNNFNTSTSYDISNCFMRGASNVVSFSNIVDRDTNSAGEFTNRYVVTIEYANSLSDLSDAVIFGELEFWDETTGTDNELDPIIFTTQMVNNPMYETTEGVQPEYKTTSFNTAYLNNTWYSGCNNSRFDCYFPTATDGRNTHKLTYSTSNVQNNQVIGIEYALFDYSSGGRISDISSINAISKTDYSIDFNNKYQDLLLQRRGNKVRFKMRIKNKYAVNGSQYSDWLLIQECKQGNVNNRETFSYLQVADFPTITVVRENNTHNGLILNITDGFFGLRSSAQKVQNKYIYDENNNSARTGIALSDLGKDKNILLKKVNNNNTYKFKSYFGEMSPSQSYQVEVTGGQIHIKVSNTWKTGTAYIKVNGVWKQASDVYIKNNGTWKRSIT